MFRNLRQTQMRIPDSACRRRFCTANAGQYIRGATQDILRFFTLCNVQCTDAKNHIAADILSGTGRPIDDGHEWHLSDAALTTSNPMRQVTITFDRVFDIAQRHPLGQDSGEPCTEFGFESDNKKYFGVTVPGFPKITSGMTVTAILANEGDWQKVLGWVNHDTGEQTCASIAIVALGACLSAFVFIFFALLATSPEWKWTFFGSAIIVTALACYVGYKRFSVYQKLENLNRQIINEV